MLPGSTILITGGAGYLGRHLVHQLLTHHPQVKRLVVYSRDELKHYQLLQRYPPRQFPQLRCVVGDVQDAPTLGRALQGIELVVHSAALKQVPIAEANPWQAIQTNVLGTQQLVLAAHAAGVKRALIISSDKAVAPTNLYGASKLCADKLFTAANAHYGLQGCSYAGVRLGNLLGAEASVVPYFMQQRHTGVLPITHPAMTRFSMLADEAAQFVLFALQEAQPGEFLIPKLASYRITDLATAIGPNCTQTIVGLRPGEKLHEEVITPADAPLVSEWDSFYGLRPTTHPLIAVEARPGGKPVPQDFYYTAANNHRWLSVDELRAQLNQLTSPSFAG